MQKIQTNDNAPALITMLKGLATRLADMGQIDASEYIDSYADSLTDLSRDIDPDGPFRVKCKLCGEVLETAAAPGLMRYGLTTLKIMQLHVMSRHRGAAMKLGSWAAPLITVAAFAADVREIRYAVAAHLLMDQFLEAEPFDEPTKDEVR